MTDIESMTKKQKTAFKKMSSIHGSSYVIKTMEIGNDEQKEFIAKIAFAQGVWSGTSALQSTIVSTLHDLASIDKMVSDVFDIPETQWYRSRGQCQKHSYRMNRIADTFNDYSIRKILRSNQVGKKLLFSMDLSSVNSLLHGHNKWFMPADSIDEARDIFEMMVAMPLGLPSVDAYGQPSRAIREVKCHGLARWFDYNKINSQLPKDCDEIFKDRMEKLKTKLIDLEKSKSALDMSFAILNQLRAFVDD